MSFNFVRVRGLRGTTYVGVLLWTLSMHCTATRAQSCVSSCVCTNTVVCQTRLTSFPDGLPLTLTSISIVGTPTRLNMIPALKSSDIQQFASLATLYVSYSQVTRLEDNLFKASRNIRRIGLMHNKIGSINAKVFETVNMLFVLDLTGNRDCQITVGAFRKLSKLVSLYIGDLGLGSIDRNMFLGLKSLRELDLHGNKLIHLSPDVFKNLPNLKILDLSENRLNTIGQKYLPVLSLLTSFDASGNPWRCTCDLAWLKQMAPKRLLVSVAEPICLTPRHLQYKSVYRISKNQLTCISPRILSCSDPYTLQEGDELTIQCLVKGDLFPDIVFVRPDGTKLPVTTQLYYESNYTTVRNVTVPAHSASMLDRGDWKVRAVNSEGKDEKTFHVEVKISITTSSTVITTVSTVSTSVATIPSLGLHGEFGVGFFTAAGTFGGTVLLGIILFVVTACCVTKKKRIEPHSSSIDEMTFTVAPATGEKGTQLIGIRPTNLWVGKPL